MENAIYGAPPTESRAALLRALFWAAKSATLAVELIGDDRFNALLAECFSQPALGLELLALGVAAQVLFRCDSDWELDLDPVVALARNGSTVDVRAAALEVLQNVMDCERAVGRAIDRGAFEAIAEGVSGSYKVRSSAAWALANVLTNATPEVISGLMRSGLVELLPAYLAVDDRECVCTILDGFVRVLDIESRDGRLCECWMRFRNADGLLFLEELDAQGAPEIAGRLAALFESNEKAKEESVQGTPGPAE
jgi:hypothetical protein